MDRHYAIFDMDGTLVDSMVYWQRLGREFLASKGITEDVDPILERIKTMTMPESAVLFLDSFALSGTPESIVDEMSAVMEAHYYHDVLLKPGTAEYLTALRNQGVHLCVATATAEPLAIACLERLGVAKEFDFILSCETVAAGKERPDVFLEAARRLGAQPDEIAVYEDALHAVKTAKSAGFRTVGVYDVASDADWELLRAFADEAMVDWKNV